MALAAHLQRLLLLQNRDWEDNLIMTFDSNLEIITQVDIMENF